MTHIPKVLRRTSRRFTTCRECLVGGKAQYELAEYLFELQPEPVMAVGKPGSPVKATGSHVRDFEVVCVAHNRGGTAIIRPLFIFG